MAFRVAQSALESLEWARVIEALRTACRTPQSRARLAGGDGTSLFEPTAAGVRARLRETSEARTLLDREASPPFGSEADPGPALARAEKGGVLEPGQLVGVREALESVHGVRRFLVARDAEAPALAARAAALEPLPELAARLVRDLDAGGEVRDAASPALAEARRDARKLAADLQGRIERILHHADVAPHLSDQFYTVRNDRYVLPVRADAKGRVRGIVHDASRSGTTLYVEPESTIELNNRHRQAELAIARETLRVLRELSAEVGRHAATLRADLEILVGIDLAFARGELSRRLDAVEPEVGAEGVFELPGLRHPSIPPTECVANDLRLGRDFRVLVLSGPNAGGKTVALKAVALAALCVRAGLHVAADPGARVDLVGEVLADIGDHQDIAESLSTFSAAMASLAGTLRAAGPDTLVCLDEIGVGTDPSEGAAIAQAALEMLAESGARTVTTTHYNLLKEMAEVDPRFENASVEFDPETLAPTYRVRIGAPGASSATTVAARMGMPRRVLERAGALLDREDRQLDRMLAELAASRAQLEREQAAAETARRAGESAREEYRRKLARLQERRDRLFGEMRAELDASFRAAHEEVARTIAELQREPSSRRAAAARDRLESLREATDRAQSEQGLVPEAPPAEARSASESAGPIDWPRARVGDPVVAPGGGSGRLLTLPDRRGRVFVRVGGAKLRVDRDQLAAPDAIRQPRAGPERGDVASASRATTAEPERDVELGSAEDDGIGLGGTLETDLRGLHVDEALERLDGALDLAAAQGRDEVRVIHGIGTGALKRAVREHLPRSRYVVEWLEAARDEGGAGATRAVLRSADDGAAAPSG